MPPVHQGRPRRQHHSVFDAQLGAVGAQSNGEVVDSADSAASTEKGSSSGSKGSSSGGESSLAGELIKTGSISESQATTQPPSQVSDDDGSPGGGSSQQQHSQGGSCMCSQEGDLELGTQSAYQPAAQGQKVERRKGSRKGTDVAWTKPEPCAVSYDTVYWERRLAKGAVAKANPLEG